MKRSADEAITPVPSDMALPTSTIMRILKSKLPDGLTVHKDARIAFSKACSIFIIYLTSCASDVSKESKRVTVTGQDVIKALKELEFDDLVEHMEVCLAAFRETEKARALAARAKKAKTSGESTGVQDGAEDADEEADVADGEDGEAPADDEDGEDIEDDEGAETELEGEDLEGARVGTGEEAEQE